MSTILLFDVDGTLTLPMESIETPMVEFLKELKRGGTVLGFVGGSDLPKIKKQLGESIDLFDYWFPENGTLYYFKGDLIKSNNLLDCIGESRYMEVVNYTLGLLSDIHLPFKRGNFIELRTSVINISPVGRSVTKKERLQFNTYDKENNIRLKMVENLRVKFPYLTFSIGGQISFDCFPKGWDKRFCLQYLPFENIYFFGDKTAKGGNDFEIFTDNRTVGISVNGPEDTMKKVLKINKV